MKKFIACILTIIMILSFTTVAFAADKTTFGDISKSAYKEAIEEMYELGVVNGYTQTRFGPDYALSRAQAAQIFVNALYNEDDVKISVILFEDVPANQWYYKAVNTAYYYGIIHGMSATKFAPEDDVSYNQFTAMLLNAMGYDVTELTGAWPTNVQIIASYLGLYKNMGVIADSTTAITRAEACQMIYNALHLDTVILKNGKFVSTGKTLYEAMGFEYKNSNSYPITTPSDSTTTASPDGSLSVMFGYAYTYGDGYIGLRVYVDNEDGTYTEYKTAGTVVAEYVTYDDTYTDYQLYDADYDYVDLHAGDEIFLELTYPGSGVYKITKVVCHHIGNGVTDWPDADIPVDQPGTGGSGSTGDVDTPIGGKDNGFPAIPND